jgi:adenylate cyclase
MAAGQVRLFRGDFEQAVEHASAAWRLARYEPWRYHLAANLAFSHYLASRYEAAWAWAQKGLEAAEYLQLRFGAAAALGQLGRSDEAAHQVEKITETWPEATASSVVRNARWEHQKDIDHYREGLEKAGLPA